MKVYFAHGKESGPWGFKIKRLAEIATSRNCDVESVDYTDLMDPDLRVDRLQQLLKDETEDLVLVGSSMGGYVSLVVSETAEPRAVFLMAPALYIPTWKKQQYHSKSPHIEIVHGWSDAVIPAENSIRYARDADCTLHLINGDHPLNDSIEAVERLFDRFLEGALGPQPA
jgi:predicted esterase